MNSAAAMDKEKKKGKSEKIEENLDAVYEFRQMIQRQSPCTAYRLLKAPYDLLIVSYEVNKLFFPIVLCKVIATTRNYYHTAGAVGALSKMKLLTKHIPDVQCILVVRFAGHGGARVRWSVVWIDDMVPVKVSRNKDAIVSYVH